MKKLLILIIFIFSFSLLPSSVRAATEFVTTIKASGGDYSTLSSWEDAIECDLTTAKTIGWDNQVGSDIADGTAVTWDGGASSGTLLHMTTTAKSGSNTFLLIVAAGTLDNNDTVTDGTNSFDVNGTPDSVIAVAKIDGTWTSADTTPVTIDGWTTSTTNYIKIYTTSTARHDGKWNTNKYYLNITTYNNGIYVQENYVRIEGIQIQINQSYKHVLWLSGDGATGGLVKLSHSIIKGNYSGSKVEGKGISTNNYAVTYHIYNNLIYDFINPGYTGFIGIYAYEGTGYIYNNTVHNSYTGVLNGVNRTRTYKNNIVNDCSNVCWSIAGTLGSATTYNITNTSAKDGAWGTAADSGTTDGAAANKLIQSGQNFLTTVKVGMVVKNTTDTTYSYVTAVDSDTQLTLNDDIMASGEAFTIYTNMYGNVAFLDEAGDDFHLDPTDTVAKDKGTDLSGDAKLAFSDDIDGDTRLAPWDVGADEYVVSNTAPTITSVTDYPDPLEVSKTIIFSVDWNDADAEGIYMYICKAEDGGASGCGGGGTWCSYTDTYTTTDPITCNYAVQTADVGVKNYYAYVCDNEPTCSSATSGTFTVQSASTGSVRFNTSGSAGSWTVDGLTYTTRIKLTIEADLIDADLTDLPVLVKLTDARFDWTHSNADGYDIRFTSSDESTLLKYERERHDGADYAEYWVKVPSVSGTVDTDFYMYYRTTDTADGADPTNVWDVNYKMVQHLKDLTTSTVADSTGVHNGTKASANNPIEADAKIARGQDFSSDYISMADHNDFSPTAISVCGWFNADTLTAATVYSIAAKGDGAGKYEWGLLMYGDDPQFVLWSTTGSNYLSAYDSTVNLSTGVWYYICGVSDGSTFARVYINGVQKAVDTTTSGTRTGNQTSAVEIGRRPDAVGAFDGIIDEVHFCNDARTAAEIKADYNSGNDSLLSYGPEETYSSAAFRIHGGVQIGD